MKPGFLIYNDYRETLSSLTDDELGKLIRVIFNYEIDGVSPVLNSTLMMAFNFIKQDLDRGTTRYDKTCERNRINGQKGGRPKKNPNNPVGILETQITQANPKKPTKLNLTKLNESNTYISKWNEVFKTNYTSTRQIDKPLSEWLGSYSIEQICKAIENTQSDPYWKGKDLDPIWLLRCKDKSGEVDRIGKMLNVKGEVNNLNSVMGYKMN